MPKIKETGSIDEENSGSKELEVATDESLEGLEEVKPPVKELGPGAKRRRAVRLPVGSNTEQEEEAIRVAESRKLPPLPGFRPTWEQAEAYVQGLTLAQWSRLFAYVWRRKPLIIREPKYIDVISEQRDFRREYIKDTHGGGKYRIGLQDSETRAGKNVMIMDISLDIPLTEADPKLDLTELDQGDKQNKTYVERLKARGILDMDGNEVTKKTAIETSDASIIGLLRETLGHMTKMQIAQVQEAVSKRGEDPEARVLEKTIGMMERGSDSREKLLMERIREQDPSKTLDMVDKIMNRVAPKDALSGGDIFKQLLAMQESSHKAQMEMMQKLIEVQTSKGDEDTKVLEKLRMLKDFIGGSSGGKRPWHESLFEALPSVLQYGSNIVGNIVAARMKAPMMPPTGPPSPPPVGGGEIITNPPANTVTEQPHINPDEFVQANGAYILNAISQGTTGDAFAGAITDLYGMAIYHVAANIGKDSIITAMQNNPGFMLQAKPIWPQVVRFIDEFLAFGTEIEPGSPPPMGEEENGSGGESVQ